MPYLEYLFCEHCGKYARLDIDSAATLEAYREEGRKQVAIVQPTLIWDYLIYSCGICGNKYRYTYRDVELKVREYFSSFSTEFKEYLDAVIPNDEDRKDELSTPPEQPQAGAAERRVKVEERVRDIYTAKN